MARIAVDDSIYDSLRRAEREWSAALQAVVASAGSPDLADAAAIRLRAAQAALIQAQTDHNVNRGMA